MQDWKYESLFAEYIAEEDLVATSFRTHRRQPSVNPTERAVILQNIAQALQRLQFALNGQDLELHWVKQLLAYIQRLQSMSAPRSAEDQFTQLYILRKWLFWVPITLLRRQGGQGAAMLALSHFYATALALEPLFPDLGSSFCSAMALPPLEAIINVTDAMRSEQSVTASSMEIDTLMQFPRQTALSYRSHAIQINQPTIQQDSPMIHFNPETLSYASIGNISPAFAPSTPSHYGTPLSASSQSPFLEVPSANPSFGYGTQNWATVPSQGFPQVSSPQDEQIYGYMPPMGGGFRGGCVESVPIWT
jgi:hypothetical protein